MFVYSSNYGTFSLFSILSSYLFFISLFLWSLLFVFVSYPKYPSLKIDFMFQTDKFSTSTPHPFPFFSIVIRSWIRVPIDSGYILEVTTALPPFTYTSKIELSTNTFFHFLFNSFELRNHSFIHLKNKNNKN